MRLSTLATTLFATLVAAQQQQQPQEASPTAVDSTMMQTLTLTKTVERVVETVTSTRNASYATVSPSLSTASAGVVPLANGTSTVLGTGAGFPGGVPTGLAESRAGKVVGLEMLGVVAVAGLVGLVGLWAWVFGGFYLISLISILIFQQRVSIGGREGGDFFWW
jgi:hypothetical protein